MMYFGRWNQYHQINPWRITLVSILIGHNVNHFQSLYFVSQPPWQNSSMPSSHFGFDKARLHDTSEIPNKRMKLNNMSKNNTFDSVMSILSSKENKSKDIRTNKVENELRQHYNAFNIEFNILIGRKMKVVINVGSVAN